MRWTTVGSGEEEGALFDADALADRHVGRGEFAGMEFLHVNARQIINRVPASSHMPFSYTINAYRGCSHACSYCLTGDTPILMADGSWRSLAEIRPGDEVVGTIRRGSYRRYEQTVVLDHWATVKPAWRVTLADGTELVASGDHRFLTGRGWKHVTGTNCGAGQRPHLTLSDKLLGFGASGRAEPANVDYRIGYLCGMARRDAHLGTYHGDRGRGEGGGRVRRACELIDWPAAPSTDWRRGFLAGIFDAEGGRSGGVLRISDADPDILAETELALKGFGFECVVEPSRANGARCVRVRGGVREHIRFLRLVDPAISRKRSIAGAAIKSDAALGVAAIEELGIEMPMYDITTGTGDFIANGVVSHNCFARPTHDYLGLGIGEDFERKIVVKVNAVERLRAELAAKRWAGHPIAMGTNTDPYQRCEGKYHLTQGIVEVLGEAANPFSILTKSTLILRDLDRLVAAARRTDVRVNLSIGTLDDDVWKLAEPGTPRPRARVEAVRRLRDAGLECGVLVAPILPGLSDRDEQIAEVVEACVGAGATSISSVALHLRPGVREHYLGWLQQVRPDLAAATEAKYVRSYLPKAEQQELSAKVRRLVDDARRRHPSAGRFAGGRFSERVRAHMGGDATPPAEGRPAEAEQLKLGW